MNRKGWTWDEYLKTWLFETETEGCGVFQEGGFWTANVAFGEMIENLGPFLELDQAMEAAEQSFQKKKEVLDKS